MQKFKYFLIGMVLMCEVIMIAEGCAKKEEPTVPATQAQQAQSQTTERQVKISQYSGSSTEPMRTWVIPFSQMDWQTVGNGCVQFTINEKKVRVYGIVTVEEI